MLMYLAKSEMCFSGVSTIPQVHYSHNDVAVFARFCYWLGDGLRSYFRRLLKKGNERDLMDIPPTQLVVLAYAAYIEAVIDI